MQAKKRGSRKGVVKKIILSLVFILSVGCLVYPDFAMWWNADKETTAMAVYDKDAERISKAEAKKMLAAADEYNRKLIQNPYPFTSSQPRQGYDKLLSVNGSSMIGHVEIPLLKLNLPVYHYTTDESMSDGAGHLVGSSLPVGGDSTHAVLAAHCGMPDKELFTHLEKLQEGDVFYITVLGRKTSYQVDQISVVVPTDTGKVRIVKGKDYVTLLTCTPFGINDHRLLVRGHRIPNEKAAKAEKAAPKHRKFTWKMVSPRTKIVLFFAALTTAIIIVIKIVQRIQARCTSD